MTETHIYTLSRAEIADLARAFTAAHDNEYTVRLAWDGGIKVKVREGMWTAGLGTEQQR